MNGIRKVLGWIPSCNFCQESEEHCNWSCVTDLGTKYTQEMICILQTMKCIMCLALLCMEKFQSYTVLSNSLSLTIRLGTAAESSVGKDTEWERPEDTSLIFSYKYFLQIISRWNSASWVTYGMCNIYTVLTDRIDSLETRKVLRTSEMALYLGHLFPSIF